MNKARATIPAKGLEKAQIYRRLKEYATDDADYRQGRTWSLVYYLGEEYTAFLKEAYGLYFSENALNPIAFASLKRLETEVVQMTAGLLHGDGDVVGCMTSGGTESCLMAVKTYRDFARATRGIAKPEMILPESAHVAFEKAAEYFGVKAVHAPLDADYRADMRAVKKLINRNTILLVASTPSYPHGVVDPIEELGRLAQRHHLPLHVDGCLGGFLLPFVERLGHDVPPFDFRVPGVCSMSADVHKYGYAAKGASVLMYRNMKHFKHQFFLYENWPGGIFLSPGLLGTRPGGPIGAAWAALQAMGENGYLRHARTVMQTTKRLQAGVNAVPGLAVVGRPHMSVFAYRSTDPAVNILAVGDQMEKRGWHIDRQQKPDSLHAMVTPRHAAVVDDYLRDLRASVDYVRAHPEAALEAGAALYGMAFSVPFRSLVKNDLLKTAMKMYGPECEIPSLGEDGASDDPLKKVGLLFLQAKNRLAGWWDKKKP